MLIETITILALFGVFYAYFGYPICLKIFSKSDDDRQEDQTLEEPPKISIIITVRNEAAILKKKIEQTLSLSYFGKEKKKLEIIIASDASDDGSDEIVQSFADRGVVLARLEKRGGKEVAQGEALRFASGDLVLFTDAKIELNSDALENIVQYFLDPTVGILSSIDKIDHADEEGSGEGFYIKYEMWLRRLESRFGSLVGVSGSAFVVRKQICAPWRDDIPSDFALLLRAQEMGLRGVMADNFIGTYRTVKTEEEEFSRKVRTVLRGMTTLFRCREAFNFTKCGWFSFQVISHKLFRWLVPWFVIVATVGIFSLSFESSFYCYLAVLTLIAYLAALAAFLKHSLRSIKIFKIPLFFIVANSAIFLAWIYYLIGKRSVAWSPSQKDLV